MPFPVKRLFLLLLFACHPDKGGESDTTSVGLDVAERLGPGQVRAGVVADEAALFSGPSAEGRLGDFKIYNDLAQFIVQQPGDSSYYVEYGGGLIDADRVRAEGEPGRDLVDEVAVMAGLGRIQDGQTVVVLADGSEGVATVRVEGPAAPMKLATGALENPDLVEDLDLWFVTDYTLRPDEPVLEVTTTLTSRESGDETLSLGDVALVGLDVGEVWAPGVGLAGTGDDPLDQVVVVGRRNEVAFGLLGADAPLEQGTIGRILGSFAPVISGFGPTTTLPAGGSLSFTRLIGVAADPATLAAAQAAHRGQAPELRSGVVVDAAGAAVPGARVHVLGADGAPLALAFAGADGAWSLPWPPGGAELVASGRGHGLSLDLPPGHGQLSPYEVRQEDTLATLSSGATPIPFAEGCGVGTPDPTTPTLGRCGRVVVHIADGGPGVVHLYPLDEEPTVDERLVPGRPDGARALGFVRDGELAVDVEPGRYLVVVSRGVRDELWTEELEVVAGTEGRVDASILPAYTLDGVVTGDPHSHASPSGDGGISMEDRVLVTAANGIDVHFGTDHDHVADYRPAVTALGLDGWMRSVVADEVSPVLRGHFNVWPAQLDATAANHGAPRWWLGYDDTEEIFGWMRALAVPGGVVQANHPVGSSGMFSFADYDIDAGTLGSPDHWSEDFDAMEVLNSGDWEEYFPYYLDLVRRGKDVLAVGVSDSHTHTSGGVGTNLTFFLSGTDLAGFDDPALLATVAARATVVSRGPYVEVTVGGQSAPGGTFPSAEDLRIRVLAPSWMPVEQVTVWVDGVAEQSFPCAGAAPTWCEVQTSLSPLRDASVVVTAESLTQPMVYAHPGTLAWAMAGAFRLDLDGDGWTAPYPALVPAR